MNDLDRRGRRTQLETMTLIGRDGPLTEAEAADALGGAPESVGRRLRRYRRRGWLGVSYGEAGPEYFLREGGAARVGWIRAKCCRTVKQETRVRA